MWHNSHRGIGWLGVFLGVVVAGVAGCNREPAPGPPPKSASSGTVIGYSAPELFAAQTAIMNGFIRQAEEKGWSVLVANANNDTGRQASQIDYLLSRDVAAIVAVPVDSRSICGSVARVADAGVPFYTIDRAPIGCEAEMCVLSDNRLAGEQAAEHMVAALTAKNGSPRGVVLELQGNLAQNVAQLRGQGFRAVVDRHPDIQVVSRETKWIAAEHARHVSEVLKTQALDGIYLHSDGAGVEIILPLLKEKGKLRPRGAADHIIITGVDGSPEALRAIRQGYVDQASSQPIPDFGIIADWIEKRFAKAPIEPATVESEGALWSPATLRRGDTGWVLLLRTTSVTVDNVYDPALWGNQPQGLRRE